MKIHTINYSVLAKGDLSPAEASLCEAATLATKLAYAPYSKFFVGASAKLDTGELIKAANLENAAYPQCLCAEATLLGTLHTQYSSSIIEAIAVDVATEKRSQDVAAPCGSCRQQLFEAELRQGKPFALYLVDIHGGAIRFESAASILPFGFIL